MTPKDCLEIGTLRCKLTEIEGIVLTMRLISGMIAR